MMGKLRITKAGVGDFEPIFALEQAVFGLESKDSLMRALRSPSFDYFKAEMTDDAAEAGNLVSAVAVSDKAAGGDNTAAGGDNTAADNAKAVEAGRGLVGFIATNNLSPEGEILSVAVDEKARNNGVGKALLSHALGYLKTKGVDKVFLEVSVDNVAAIALYRGAGFEDLYVRKDYYNDHGHGVDALILVINI